MQNKIEITTIKLHKTTKSRLDKLKSYPKESYEEILKKILEILNLYRINPEKAKNKLLIIDQDHKKNLQQTAKQSSF